MTKEEIKAKINSLEDEAFYLNMKDRWSNSDFDYMNALRKKIAELRKELEND